MVDSLKVHICMDLEPLLFWILLLLGFSMVNGIRYLIFKHELLVLIKEQIPELFGSIFTSRKDLLKFITMGESIGNDSVDLLRLKAKRAWKLFIGPSFYIIVLILHIFLSFFLLVRM